MAPYEHKTFYPHVQCVQILNAQCDIYSCLLNRLTGSLAHGFPSTLSWTRPSRDEEPSRDSVSQPFLGAEVCV
jgi:hypothetical protein